MNRLFDWAVELWDRVRRLAGFDRFKRETREAEARDVGRARRILYFARPVLALLVVLYTVAMVSRLTVINGDDLGYPQLIVGTEPPAVAPGAQGPDGACGPSAVAQMTAHILDVLVNQNTWVPADPQYKIGWFGVAPFASGPFFDNKASFQIGALRAVRRISIEMVDLLGRARGTSAADPNLQDARGSVQWNERSWIVNPFDPRLPLLSTAAATSYRSAIEDYRAYNDKLVACEALYDSRSDNLFQLLDRIANEVGGMTDQLASRSKGDQWDVASKQIVPGTGNNRGFFDFRADNLFYEAHGLMWAYHGLLQAIRADFSDVVVSANLGQIWDRMESHVAESASLEPFIVSNGREDSVFTPDHLSAMAANMLRARANMTEIREVLAR